MDVESKRRRIEAPDERTDKNAVPPDDNEDESTFYGYDEKEDGSMVAAFADLQQDDDDDDDDDEGRSSTTTPVFPEELGRDLISQAYDNEVPPWQVMEPSPPFLFPDEDASYIARARKLTEAEQLLEEMANTAPYVEEEYNMPASMGSYGGSSDTGYPGPSASSDANKSGLLDFSQIGEVENADEDAGYNSDTDLITDAIEPDYFLQDPDIHGFSADPWRRLSFRLRRLFRDRSGDHIKSHVSNSDDVAFAHTSDFGEGADFSKRTEFVFSVLAGEAVPYFTLGLGPGAETQVEDRNSLNRTSERLFRQWFRTASEPGPSVHAPIGTNYLNDAIILIADLGTGRSTVDTDGHWIILVRQVTRAPEVDNVYSVKWSIIDTLSEPHADYYASIVETAPAGFDRLADMADNMAIGLEHRVAKEVIKHNLPYKIQIVTNTPNQSATDPNANDQFSLLHRIAIIPEEMRPERWLWHRVHRRITLGALVRLRNTWSVCNNCTMQDVFPQPPELQTHYPYHLNGFRLCRTDALEPMRDHYYEVTRRRAEGYKVPRSVLWYPGRPRGPERTLTSNSDHPSLMRVPLRLRDLRDNADTGNIGDFVTDTLGSKDSAAETYLQDAMNTETFIHPSVRWTN
jgi:hypothetical protein